MLETVYIGLAQLPKLTSLTIRFPSSRHPRPTTVIPPMPHIQSLKITDIDPLCYPDDISTLLLRSRKMQVLKMHWSPRMKLAQEPSVTLHDYFRKCIAEKSPLKLKKLALQNMYALHTEEFEGAIDRSTIEEVATLNSPGVEDDGSMASFVDNSWTIKCPESGLRLKTVIQDRVSSRQCSFLEVITGLENIYFVDPAPAHGETINTPRAVSTPSSPCTSPSAEGNNAGNSQSLLTPKTNPAGGAGSSSYPSSPKSPRDSLSLLTESYISAITSSHGESLRRLLLPSRFKLSSSMVARLVRGCPNLEQLGLATELSSLDNLGLLFPFLRNLKALRLLIPTTPNSSQYILDKDRSVQKVNKNIDAAAVSANPDFNPVLHHFNNFAEIVELDDSFHNEVLSVKLADTDVCSKLRVLGLGWKVWELGSFYTIPASEAKPSIFSEDSLGGNSSANEGICQPGTNGTAAPSSTQFDPQQPPVSTPAPPPLGPSQQQQQQSSLGKRSRESNSQPQNLPKSQRKASADQTSAATQPNGSTNVNDKEEKFVRRRHIKRVGREVLKHWEIWARDVQEI